MAAQVSNKLWRVVLDGSLDGLTNMARDRDLLELAEDEGISTLRFYTWDGVWISLGYFQTGKAVDGEQNTSLTEEGLAVRDRIDLEACKRLGVRLVQRPTGGKAVLHGHDLTITLACPLRALNTDAPNIKKIYRTLAAKLIDGLNEAGIPAVLGEALNLPAARTKSADCFVHVSPNDIVHAKTQQKLIGCALRVTSKAALMQTSIPLREPLVPPADLFGLAFTTKPLDVTEGRLIEAITNQFE